MGPLLGLQSSCTLSLCDLSWQPSCLQRSFWQSSLLACRFDGSTTGSLGLDFLGPLGQFRAPGRFAWPLYYVLSLVGFAWLASQIKVARANSERWKHRLLVAGAWVGILTTATEGVALQRWVVDRGRPAPNAFNLSVVERTASLAHISEALKAIDPALYQAILTVPLFHIGSELVVPPSATSGDFLRDAFALSKHLRLPLMSSMLGRVSREESLETFLLYSQVERADYLCSKLMREAPILVLANQDRSLSSMEIGLLEMLDSDRIYQNERFEAFRIEPSTLCDPTGLKAKTRVAQNSVPEERVSLGQVVLSRSYDEHSSSRSFLGAGALGVAPRELVWIFDSSDIDDILPSLADSTEGGRELVRDAEQSAILSFWFANEGSRLQADFVLERSLLDARGDLVSRAGRHEPWLDVKRTFRHTDGWSRFSTPLVFGPRERVRVGVRGRHLDEPLWIDELQVQRR